MNLTRTPGGLAVQTPSGPLPIRYLLCIGRNYGEHAREQGKQVLSLPIVFSKNPGSMSLSGDSIVIPKICRDEKFGGEQTDYEAELCVILGRDARDVPRAKALDFVLGYTCVNDVSARWWQKEGSGGQYSRGKSFDTFCPMGPRVVPAAEIPNPQALRVQCRLNGQVMQDASTADMLFPVTQLIADLSQGTTLVAGTAILTGTPGGVGMARTPPVWLKDGDTVEVEIDRIGVLRNPVRAE